MGGKKQLTPWFTATGTIPLVAAAYDAIRPVCDEMVVVLGHAANEVAAALGARPFHRAESDPDAPMFESIRAGVRFAERLNSAAAIVLQPGDHPEVATSTLGILIKCSLECPELTIIPEYARRGGHPVIIPPKIAGLLLEAECPAGLGQFWLDHPELCRRVSLDDPNVVHDIDTPADLL
jgi:CTP:molybdopterin cytidylyltransferase MocA